MTRRIHQPGISDFQVASNIQPLLCLFNFFQQKIVAPDRELTEQVSKIINAKKLEIEVTNLKEELAIEKKFRSLESSETSQQIEELLKFNESLTSKLNEFKLKQEVENAVKYDERCTQTENVGRNIVAELESIRTNSIEMKKHYDEIIKENKELVLKIDEEKDEKEKVTQEMMTEHHLLGRRNTELLREIDEIKLKKYSEVDVDFTEELRFAKVDFGEDIKAVMNEIHKLLIENKILKSKLNKNDFSIRKDTNVFKLKEELLKELHEMKKIYDKDHEEMRKDYDAVVRERKNLIVQVKEQKTKLLDGSNLISDLQSERKDNEVKLSFCCPHKFSAQVTDQLCFYVHVTHVDFIFFNNFR